MFKLTKSEYTEQINTIPNKNAENYLIVIDVGENLIELLKKVELKAHAQK